MGWCVYAPRLQVRMEVALVISEKLEKVVTVHFKKNTPARKKTRVLKTDTRVSKRLFLKR